MFFLPKFVIKDIQTAQEARIHFQLKKTKRIGVFWAKYTNF